MKRNPAYMSPVEAFEDAFADLRNHQIAMLAGMRVAFESMLAEFDPDRLQQEFDRQLAKGLVPAKMRYWDSYRERQQQIVKDPEASFRRLFGEEFARAYEEQLKQLKARQAAAPAVRTDAEAAGDMNRGLQPLSNVPHAAIAVTRIRRIGDRAWTNRDDSL